MREAGVLSLFPPIFGLSISQIRRSECILRDMHYNFDDFNNLTHRDIIILSCLDTVPKLVERLLEIKKRKLIF